MHAKGLDSRLPQAGLRDLGCLGACHRSTATTYNPCIHQGTVWSPPFWEVLAASYSASSELLPKFRQGSCKGFGQFPEAAPCDLTSKGHYSLRPASALRRERGCESCTERHSLGPVTPFSGGWACGGVLWERSAAAALGPDPGTGPDAARAGGAERVVGHLARPGRARPDVYGRCPPRWSPAAARRCDRPGCGRREWWPGGVARRWGL